MHEGYWLNTQTDEAFLIDDHEQWIRRPGHPQQLGLPKALIAVFAKFTPIDDRIPFLTHLLKNAPIVRIRGHMTHVTVEFAAREPAPTLAAVGRFAARFVGRQMLMNIVNLETNEAWSMSASELAARLAKGTGGTAPGAGAGKERQAKAKRRRPGSKGGLAVKTSRTGACAPPADKSGRQKRPMRAVCNREGAGRPQAAVRIVAIIWDFDQTLSPEYMQAPLLRHYRVAAARFWRECAELRRRYQAQGLNVTGEACYLNHILTYVRLGRFAGLNNAMLRRLGRDIGFFPGLLDFLRATRRRWPGRNGKAKVEHYVVSAGLAELIRGSALAPLVDGIWASEFIETPFVPGPRGLAQPATAAPVLTQLARLMDSTGKTRALFEINKGVNVDPANRHVDQPMPEAERRVPFARMIYVADGPSDIPAFSLVRHFGGKTLAVFDPESPKSRSLAARLQADGRADRCGPADYRDGSPTREWLLERLAELANRG